MFHAAVFVDMLFQFGRPSKYKKTQNIPNVLFLLTVCSATISNVILTLFPFLSAAP